MRKHSGLRKYITYPLFLALPLAFSPKHSMAVNDTDDAHVDIRGSGLNVPYFWLETGESTKERPLSVFVWYGGIHPDKTNIIHMDGQLFEYLWSNNDVITTTAPIPEDYPDSTFSFYASAKNESNGIWAGREYKGGLKKYSTWLELAFGGDSYYTEIDEDMLTFVLPDSLIPLEPDTLQYEKSLNDDEFHDVLENINNIYRGLYGEEVNDAFARYLQESGPYGIEVMDAFRELYNLWDQVPTALMEIRISELPENPGKHITLSLDEERVREDYDEALRNYSPSGEAIEFINPIDEDIAIAPNMNDDYRNVGSTRGDRAHFIRYWKSMGEHPDSVYCDVYGASENLDIGITNGHVFADSTYFTDYVAVSTWHTGSEYSSENIKFLVSDNPSGIDTEYPMEPDGPEYPREPVLRQNYPNPFNPITTIEFETPENYEKTKAKMGIYDIRGRLVNNILEEDVGPGKHYITWDGTDTYGRRVEAGVYFYRLHINNHTYVKKAVIIQ